MPPTKRAYTRRAVKKTSPSSGQPIRFMHGVVGEARRYKDEISQKEQEEIQEAEEDAPVSKGCLTDAEIRSEFEALVPYLRSTRGRATLYQKTLNYHWYQKAVLGKALDDRGEAQAEILLQQDDMVGYLKQILYNQQQVAQRIGVALAKEPTSQVGSTGLNQ